MKLRDCALGIALAYAAIVLSVGVRRRGLGHSSSTASAPPPPPPLTSPRPQLTPPPPPPPPQHHQNPQHPQRHQHQQPQLPLTSPTPQLDVPPVPLALPHEQARHVLNTTQPPSGPQRAPNVLFILSDDHSAEAVSFRPRARLGKLAETTHLSRLAAGGVVIEDSFVVPGSDQWQPAFFGVVNSANKKSATTCNATQCNGTILAPPILRY